MGHSLSVSSEAGFELFRIHEGKRQDSRLKQTERNGSKKKFKAVAKVRFFFKLNVKCRAPCDL